MALKDYPGTGCPICWTRKGLNDSGAEQYLTVQEVTHMVSHWRSHVNEHDFGDGELKANLATALAAVYGFSASFSDWRRAHEAAEVGNFLAEDNTAASVDVYDSLRAEESARFDQMNASFAAFENAFEVMTLTRETFLAGDQSDAQEAEHFDLIGGALAEAKTGLDTTGEARRLYFERIDAYAKQRRDAAKGVQSEDEGKTCGCGS